MCKIRASISSYSNSAEIPPRLDGGLIKPSAGHWAGLQVYSRPFMTDLCLPGLKATLSGNFYFCFSKSPKYSRFSKNLPLIKSNRNSQHSAEFESNHCNKSRKLTPWYSITILLCTVISTRQSHLPGICIYINLTKENKEMTLNLLAHFRTYNVL
jgi:hypothetical protein